MNLVDHYRFLASQITEEDVRKVAAIMADHVGEENSITKQAIMKSTGFHERKVRDILTMLVLEHGWLIGSHAGKSGYWIIDNENDRWRVVNELESREIEIRARRRVIEKGKIPSTTELKDRVPQLGLF